MLSHNIKKLIQAHNRDMYVCVQDMQTKVLTGDLFMKLQLLKVIWRTSGISFNHYTSICMLMYVGLYTKNMEKSESTSKAQFQLICQVSLSTQGCSEPLSNGHAEQIPRNFLHFCNVCRPGLLETYFQLLEVVTELSNELLLFSFS